MLEVVPKSPSNDDSDIQPSEKGKETALGECLLNTQIYSTKN